MLTKSQQFESHNTSPQIRAQSSGLRVDAKCFPRSALTCHHQPFRNKRVYPHAITNMSLSRRTSESKVEFYMTNVGVSKIRTLLFHGSLTTTRHDGTSPEPRPPHVRSQLLPVSPSLSPPPPSVAYVLFARAQCDGPVPLWSRPIASA